jgi:CubicO group peptidase (beta-lactamase class C family)
LLDPVIETATGQTLTQFFNQRLTSTTGMTGFYFQSGYNNVFISKARSMARFGLLVLNHGRWNNTTVMNDSLYFNAMVNSSQPLNPSYGYLWWLNGKSSFMAPGFQFQFPGSWSPAAPPDMFAAMGKNGQLLNIVPSMNLVWVRMGDEPSGSFVPFALNDTIWQKLNAVMCTSTGVQSQDITSSIKVSPNPATELLQIVSPRCTLQIMDATGREVELITINEPMIQLPLTMYQSGIYFFRFVLADGKGITKKVIVR